MYNWNMEISIIIPVYNAERFLERCLDATIKSLEGIKGEILLVDNGSSDTSPEIMKKYAGKYDGVVKVSHCNTRGAGAARNCGVAKARGRYLWFVDADDEISADAVRKLLDEAKKSDADMVMLGMKRVYANGHTDYLSAVRPEEKNYKSRFVRYGMGPVQVLVRREWWIQNGFRFSEQMIHEDMELMSALILYTDKFAAVDEPLYFYYQNEDSVLHKKKFDPHIFDIFPALEGLYGRFDRAGAVSQYHDELEWFFIWNLLIDSAKDFIKFPEGKSGARRSREMLKRYFPKWYRNRFLRQKPLKLQLRVGLNYFK